MRFFPLLLLAALVVPSATFAQGKSTCVVHAGPDARNFECTLTEIGADQRLRFSASFSGSHDDTTALLVAYLDGAPIACDPSSKTTLEGEDGDVTLDCTFAIGGKANGPPVLKIALTWRHAVYNDFELTISP